VKKAFLPLAIGLLLVLTPSFVPALPDATDVTPLSNKDVLTMVQNRVPEEAIVRAIKSSPCTFDTFPPVLKDMKRRGVSDAVLQAMLDAPYGPATSKSTDDLPGEDQQIYHYADQLKAMGYILPSAVSRARRYTPRQSSRSRAGRRTRQ
jgi:hypothetical protein